MLSYLNIIILIYKMSNISLQNIDNYKSEHDSSVSEIFAKYNGSYSLYYSMCRKCFIRNVNYLKYIIRNGLETLIMFLNYYYICKKFIINYTLHNNQYIIITNLLDKSAMIIIVFSN